MSDTLTYFIPYILAIIVILIVTYEIRKSLFVVTLITISLLLAFLSPYILFLIAFADYGRTPYYSIVSKELDNKILTNFSQLDLENTYALKHESDKEYVNISSHDKPFYWGELAIHKFEYDNPVVNIDLAEKLVIDGIACDGYAKFTRKGNKTTYDKENFELLSCATKSSESETQIGDNILKAEGASIYTKDLKAQYLALFDFASLTKKLEELEKTLQNPKLVTFSYSTSLTLNDQYIGSSLSVLRDINQENKVVIGQLQPLDNKPITLGECRYGQNTHFIATDFKNGQATFYFEPSTTEEHCHTMRLAFNLNYFDSDAYEAEKMLPLKKQTVKELPQEILTNFKNLRPDTEVTWHTKENRVTEISQDEVFYWNEIPTYLFTEQDNEVHLFTQPDEKSSVKLANLSCSTRYDPVPIIFKKRKETPLTHSLKLEDFELVSCKTLKTELNLEGQSLPFYLDRVQFDYPEGIQVFPSNGDRIDNITGKHYSVFGLKIKNIPIQENLIVVDNIIADKTLNVTAIYSNINDATLNQYCGYPDGQIKISMTEFTNKTALFNISMEFEEENNDKTLLSEKCKNLRLPYEIKPEEVSELW